MATKKFAMAAVVVAALAAGAAYAADQKGQHERKPMPTFEQLDTNKDGSISVAEFKAMFAKHPKMAARADKMYQRMDANKDGKVDANEFNTWKAHRGQRKPQK